MGNEEYFPLFETKQAKGRFINRIFGVSMFVAICLLWIYRATQLPKHGRIWGWIALFLAEMWFSFYWILTQIIRWNRVHRYAFKERLSLRYGNNLPKVDIFVCTADPVVEPPIMVVNTVLSVMAYDYPSEKLSIYLSDDGGSILTFYALFEASHFSKHWLPYCRKYKIEPRSPVAYFSSINNKPIDDNHSSDLASIKKLYEEMQDRIETSMNLSRIPNEVLITQHKGFSKWNDFYISRYDHDTIVEILIDGRNPEAKDVEGFQLPTLVYLAREKRPQHFHNFKAGAMNALVELAGLEVLGGPPYIGTGCFHRREALCGRKYTKEYKFDWDMQNTLKVEGTTYDLEEKAKIFASCTYELNSQWGKEMGLKYGCLVEDVITGLAIKCRGWKSVYYNPERSGFLGQGPITLADTLMQHKRWSQGNLEIMINYCPLWYGHKKISLSRQLGYCHYCFWPLNSPATLCYCIIPSLYMLKGISLFPQISSPWFLPFAYIIIGKYTYSLVEFVSVGGTFLGWWNEQRMWLYKRTSSYLFALTDTIFKLLGFSDMKFVITNKVAHEDVFRRYENEIMGFGVSSPMFIILSFIALVNLFSLVALMTKLLGVDEKILVIERFGLQLLLCGALVVINLPLIEGSFVRKDNGKMPNSVTTKATFMALLACALFYK